MLSFIGPVVVAVPNLPFDVTQLRHNLQQLGVELHLIPYSKFDEMDLAPLIVCIHDGEHQADFLHTLNEREVTYMLWQASAPQRGHLVSFASHIAPQKTSLSLDDCVSALIQSNIRRESVQFSTPHNLWLNSIIGNSMAFNGTMKLAMKIAKIDCDVLIQGETGTGKELIARLIHYESERRDHPFVPINCGAFSDELLLSELFGHTKGAYTGAVSNRVGLIEQAENGTLFLDEIDSLSSKAQVALLRYLQDREIRPQGGNTLKKTNIRVVAASNKSLQDLVERNEFRDDLLFRLDVLHIDLPPLRERDGDIHLLSQFFMRKAAKEYNLQAKVFSPNMIRAMSAYKWPGNIRQLQNIVTRLCLLSEQFVIRLSPASTLAGVDWSAYLVKETHLSAPLGMQQEKRQVVEAFESSYLKRVLALSAGNVSRAAKIARKERRSFMRLMQKYQLDRRDFEAGYKAER